MNLRVFGRGVAAKTTLVVLAGCTNTGLGTVLGSVLGGAGPGANQVSGYVQGVDTRSQYIALQSSSGQSVNIQYDNQTQVVYNNQRYPVTSLDRGDQVTARIQSTNNGSYYTDLVQVDQPVQGSNGSTASGNVQTIQGTVRGIDMQNGLFSLDMGTGTRVTVSMPYSPSRADQNRFQNLRQGDYVRIAGVYLNNTRVELRQFY
jgi:exosome complex RNA-binding protein Csl4